MKYVIAALLVTVPLLAACGSRPATNASQWQHELDKKHCTTNAECANSLCVSGRCG